MTASCVHSAVGRDRDPAYDGAGDRPPVRTGFHFDHRSPKRFRRSTDVGAYLGLVPRVHQSGEIDRMGRFTKAGDNLTRSYLVDAANVLLTRIERPYPLREWGLRIMQRAGLKKAQVAVARKLATMLHAMWTDGTEFEWRSEMA
jgi:transposase